jgi:2-oxoglutarate dehydrogenase E2 component (dihydrolipoamide succinyltransferase)
MATEFKMPQLGETVVEGTITRWLKQVGDSVEADESLVEVSTDKVDSEIPSPISGTVTRILVQEGETVGVGVIICEIGEAGEASPAKAEKAPPGVQAQATKAEPTAEPAAARDGQSVAAPQAVSTEEESRRGILSPLVRKLADERGVDLERVRGTGTGGRITKQDVMAAAPNVAPAREEAVPAKAEPAAAPLPTPAAQHEATPAAARAGDEVVKITNMRKAIAENMVKSHLEAARAWNAVEVDMTKVAKLREAAGAAFKEREGFSLTWMPFVTKAVVETLLSFPQVNSVWNGDGTVTQKHYVNLGIAVALEGGLIVPVIKGADGMSLVGLGRAVRDLADRARNKKLVPDDVSGGTFTITNPGPFGSMISVPIINKGQAGILAFDAVAKRPVVVTDQDGNDSISVRQMVYLSMSWDHRIIDGAVASQFLSHLKALLEEAGFDADLDPYLPEAR